MKICPNCGTENEDNEKVCYLCECDLEEVIVAQTQPVANSYTPNNSESSHNSTNKSISSPTHNGSGAKKAIIAVVAVGIIFMGGMLLNNSDTEETKTVNTNPPPDNYSSGIAETSSTQISEQTQSFETTPVIEDSRNTQDINIPWADAYAKQLKKYKESSDFANSDGMGSKYDLSDVNGDNIPELFISDGSYDSAYCRVYAFIDSECVNIFNDNYSYGTLYTSPDSNFIIHYNSYMGKNSLYIIKFDGKNSSVIDKFDDNLGKAGTEALKYNRNGKEISSGDYIKAYNSYTQNNLYTVGRQFYFDNISAEDIFENYKNSVHQTATIQAISAPSLYYVRKSWSNAGSQIGAYASLDNAKKACESGYTVYDENGTVIYTPQKSGGGGLSGDGLGAEERVDFQYGIVANSGNSVALLESASSGSSAKCYMRDGNGVEVKMQSNGFYYVSYNDGYSSYTGYVSKDYILKTTVLIYNFNSYPLGLIDGSGVSGFATKYVTMNGEKTTIRTALGDGWHVEARHWCYNYDVMWYELWDSQDGDYYGWVDSNFIDFYSY